MTFTSELRRRIHTASLTARLTAWYIGLMALMLLGLGAFVNIGVTKLATAAVVASDTQQNHEVSQALAPLLAAGQPLERVAQAVLNAHHGPPEVIVIADPQGRVVAHTTGPSQLVDGLIPTGLDAVRGGATEWIAVLDGGTAGQVVMNLTQLSDPSTGAIQAFVEVAAPVEQADFVGHVLLILFGLGCGILLVVAIVVGPKLTRLGLRPLRGMAGASRRLAEGDLSTRVDVPQSHDEVGDLARAFNHMAEQLEAAFAAQRAFVADASHELRTPLHALGGQIDVQLRVMEARPDEARRLAGLMRREVDRLSGLVEDLLVLARLEAQGAEALQFHVLDLGAVARDVFEQSQALPTTNGRDIELEVDEGRIPVRGDPHRLHQVLLNLMTNGLQHAPDHTAVKLAVHRRNGLACVQVSDHGPGVPPEHLSHVFDRFYRTDAARARLGGGAGLGLAIAQAIV
ncbi:MAG TPA: ATP-binding protein, partial [Chloroflexota bacterium]|nr:ATP-binding protein [Chloroflexota bacterium]